MRIFHCRRCVVFSCLFSLIGTLAVVATADAQRQRPRNPFFDQFRSEIVKRELGLSDEVLKKISDLGEKARISEEERKALYGDLGKISDRRARGAAYKAALEKTGKSEVEAAISRGLWRGMLRGTGGDGRPIYS